MITKSIHFYLKKLVTTAEFLSQSEVDERYADDITIAINTLNTEVDKLQSGPSHIHNKSDSTSVHQTYHKISLPDIELPGFDGNPANYNKFIASFESLLSKYSLSSSEKFSYLSKQLTGPAKKLIDSLDLKDLNHDSAIKLLNEAFSVKLTQQYSVIGSLNKLKLNTEAKDAYEWISQARILNDQVKSLNISGDIFTQYFLWESLCDDFRAHIVAITGKSKPSLNEIMESLFEANNRFMHVQAKKPLKHISKTVNSSAAAAAANSDFPSAPGCPLCKYDKHSSANDHRLHKCTRYASLDSKLEKLKTIGGCIKCGSNLHNAKSCNFRFKRTCTKCHKFHMFYLCDSVSKTKEKEIDASKDTKAKSLAKDSSNGMLSISSESGAFNDVILPTGTVYVGDSGNKKTLRVFKDLGSQTTFVKGCPDSIPNCKVIEKVNIKVKGINSVRTLDSCIVEFPVTVPGQGEQLLRAVCTDDISTCVKIPDLKSVVKK